VQVQNQGLGLMPVAEPTVDHPTTWPPLGYGVAAYVIPSTHGWVPARAGAGGLPQYPPDPRIPGAREYECGSRRCSPNAPDHPAAAAELLFTARAQRSKASRMPKSRASSKSELALQPKRATKANEMIKKKRESSQRQGSKLKHSSQSHWASKVEQRYKKLSRKKNIEGG
jgi:hypothetical protein